MYILTYTARELPNCTFIVQRIYTSTFINANIGSVSIDQTKQNKTWLQPNFTQWTFNFCFSNFLTNISKANSSMIFFTELEDRHPPPLLYATYTTLHKVGGTVWVNSDGPGQRHHLQYQPIEIFNCNSCVSTHGGQPFHIFMGQI